MFKLRNVTLYPLNELIKKKKKQLAQGHQRAKKARHFEKFQLGKHLETNEVNWHQVCNMISYKRDVLEMGRGSPICEKVCKNIVEYF